MRVGQDVLVESDVVLDGEAFIASIDGEKTFSDKNVYISLRDSEHFEADIALVSRDDVITLTEVFDAIKTNSKL